jgi:drug/metabolite transporter (DMT)-like permease
VYGRRFRELPPVATAAGMLVFASLYVAPAAFMFETPFSSVPGWGPITAMLALALLSSALAYILYFTVLKNAGATNAMLVTIIQPPLAILLGVTFLGETLSRNQLFGLALILAGLVLVDGRLQQIALARLKAR